MMPRFSGCPADALAKRAVRVRACDLDLAGCASAPPTKGEPPAPAVNLSGFPLEYRQGYADGCASATGPARKDAARFGADGNYRTGWQDGLALCRKK